MKHLTWDVAPISKEKVRRNKPARYVRAALQMAGSRAMTNTPVAARRDKPDGRCPKKQTALECSLERQSETRSKGEPFPDFPFDVPTFAGVIVALALLVALVAKLGAFLASRRSKPAADPTSGLPAGRLVASPSVGWGDLGWGNPRQGFWIPKRSASTSWSLAARARARQTPVR